MKVKIKKNKVVREELVTVAAFGIGVLLASLFAAFFKKRGSLQFAAEFSQTIKETGENIEKTTEQIKEVIQADPGFTPDENIKPEYNIENAERKFKEDLNRLSKQPSPEEAMALKQKPSAALGEILESYRTKIQQYVSSQKKIKPETLKRAETLLQEINKQVKTIQNVDKTYLMSNKEDPNGLWKTSIESSPLAPVLQNKEAWLNFVNLILPKQQSRRG